MKQYNLNSEKIRILHLIQGLGVGGAEILLLHYIRALGTINYEHLVYFFNNDGPVRTKLENLGVTIHKGPTLARISNPIKFLCTHIYLIKDLLNFIRNHKIQMIQSHLSQANQLAVLTGKLSRIPSFPTVHNTMAFVDRRSWTDFRVHLIKAVDAFVYKMADRVIAVSQEIKDIVIDHHKLNESKVVVVKNGIVINNSTSALPGLEKEFRTSNDLLKIIGVGSLTYQKAFEVLVRAIAHLIDQGFDKLFVLIIGDGPERESLTKLINEMDLDSYVKMPGVRNDVIFLLKSSDVFVMPSRYEGLSIAMIEAMACSLPIIASDAPGLNSYIDHEKNGLLFPVEDHNSLAKCILRLANEKELKTTISCGARMSYEKEYDMSNNILPLKRLFKESIRS